MDASRPRNLAELEALARSRLDERTYAYAAGGSDDERTVRANRRAFDELQLRCRRLVDVSAIDTRTRSLGEDLAHPIVLAPVGHQALFHPEAERGIARGAAASRALMITSSVSNTAVGDVAAAAGRPVWFQLYPTADRGITRALLERSQAAGCPAVVLTLDTPVLGNRERDDEAIGRMLEGEGPLANYAGLRADEPLLDPSMTWDVVEWLRENTSQRIVLKGIVTAEDTALATERGVDGLIVSNHGGRQEESNRGTIECLAEVVEAARGRAAVWIDGGFRRGTDVFCALALGAEAVCIGRPQVYGLAALGADGVELAVEILRTELERTMRLAGTPSIDSIEASHVCRRR